MGKQKKIKRSRASGVSGELKTAIMSRMMTTLVIIIFLSISGILVKAFLQKSDYFKLRTVDIKASFLDTRSASFISGRVLNAYKARNVFDINLKHIARFIQDSYGDVRDVVVGIRLPDKLVISLKLRRPVALVKSGKFYPVDEDGVVLPGSGRVDALNDLPIIDGVDIKRAGSLSSYRSLNLALKLLGEIRLVRSLSGLGVATISVYDPANLSFSLKNGVEIRVGEENFKERLKLLDSALRDPRLVLDNIKYIDVRFKDIIIGPK